MNVVAWARRGVVGVAAALCLALALGIPSAGPLRGSPPPSEPLFGEIHWYAGEIARGTAGETAREAAQGAAREAAQRAVGETAREAAQGAAQGPPRHCLTSGRRP